MSETATARGAIVMSGWSWQSRGSPERLATALSRAGWRVLYCSNPSSIFREGSGRRSTLAERVEGFSPKQAGHRLNAFPLARKWQAGWLVKQVLAQARQMGIERPVVFYPHGGWVVAFARELRRRNVTCAYLCMDHVEKQEIEALAEAADLVLAIPSTKYDQLKRRFGAKVYRLPQFGPDLAVAESDASSAAVLSRLESIPRPRLGYLGLPSSRVHGRLLGELLAAHPELHFLACGPVPGLRMANLYDIGWLNAGDVAAVCRRIDVGFMPYDCSRDFNRYCVPLKLFDYFAAGLPVVSTPLLHLREYGDLVYFGDTVAELAQGIRQALAEPADDPRRKQRRRIARAHSLDEMTRILTVILDRALERGSGPKAE